MLGGHWTSFLNVGTPKSTKLTQYFRDWKARIRSHVKMCNIRQKQFQQYNILKLYEDNYRNITEENQHASLLSQFKNGVKAK